MKKRMVALLALSLATAAIPAYAKGSYIGKQRAAAIAKSRVGGGHVDNIDLERSRRHGAYYEVDVENRQGEYEVRVHAASGRVLSVKRTGAGDDDGRHGDNN